MLKTILICAIFCTSASLAHVKVSVYYETLCPYSANFLVYQFNTAYQEFKDYITVALIPYGKANVSKDYITVALIPYGKANATDVSGSWEFECQHGEAECYGNKVHSCALELYPQSQSFEFIVCSMGSSNASADANLEACSISSNISWAELQECISTGKGDEYLAANGRITDKVIPEVSNSVPTIIFNDVFDLRLHKLAINDFNDILGFLHDQSRCDLCFFLPNHTSSLRSSGKIVLGVAFLIMAIQKIFSGNI